MRVALLSDIHANLAALDAILAHAGADGFDAVWVMGDLVGYGPDPDEVVERLEQLGAVCVMGNHDAATCGLIPTADFNPLAATAVEWTREHTSETTRAYLARLPRVATEGDFTLVHGTLRDPIWEYMSTLDSADAHLRLQRTRYSAVGHTHFQLLASLNNGSVEHTSPHDGEEFALGGGPLVINPGGAGQPRDRDERANYALLDLEALRVRFARVPYDIAATQERMRERGLPEPLAARLSLGR